MDNAEYTRRVLARNSHQWHPEKVSGVVLTKAVGEFARLSDIIDRIKKVLLYGRDDAGIAGEPPMNGSGTGNYVYNEQDQRIIHAIIGVMSEAGELADAWINGEAVYKGDKPRFDHTNLREEFGDIMWYLALGLDAIGSSITEAQEVNDAKLEVRYGAVFTPDAALNRDLDAERLVLEQGRPDDDADGKTEGELLADKLYAQLTPTERADLHSADEQGVDNLLLARFRPEHSGVAIYNAAQYLYNKR